MLLKKSEKNVVLSANFIRLWWTDASDPAYCRAAHGVRVTAMCWVEGVCPPQPMIWTNAARCHGGTTKTKKIPMVGIVQKDFMRKNSPQSVTVTVFFTSLTYSNTYKKNLFDNILPEVQNCTSVCLSL